MMFTRVMLIGLLVLSAVAMLETDASAQRVCRNWGCTFFFREDGTELTSSQANADLATKVAPIRRGQSMDVQIIGRDDDVGRTRVQVVQNKLIGLLQQLGSQQQPAIRLQPQNPAAGRLVRPGERVVRPGERVVRPGEVDVVIKPSP